MIRKKERARKYASILTMIYVAYDFTSLDTSIKVDKDKIIIAMTGSVNDKLVNIEKLKQIFNKPRLYEYDDYYEGLLDSSDESELKYLAYLVDYFKINYDSGVLDIEVGRNSR